MQFILQLEQLMSPLVQWLALRFCHPQVLGSNPVGDYHGYELFGKIALRNRRFYFIKDEIQRP